MRKILLVVIFLACMFCEAESSCLTVLDDKKCSEMQDAGQKLAKTIREEDNIIQEVLFRATKESLLIVDSSMKFLKEKYSVKITNPGITPIESSELAKLQNSIQTTALATVKEGNKMYWALLKKGAKIMLKDDLVASALLVYPKKVKRNTASTNSLTGTAQALQPEMQLILSKVAKDLQVVSEKLYDVYVRSLKVLLSGKVALDFDAVKTNLQNYFQDAVRLVIQSHMKSSLVILKESVSQIAVIDGLVQKIKNDPNLLQQALSPAKALISEALEDTQSPADDDELKKKLLEGTMHLKKYIEDIKKTGSL